MEEIRDIFGKELLEIGKKEKRIIVLDADVGSSTRSLKFSELGQRFIQCGIAEQNMMGISAGLALKGMIPIVTSFAVFVTGRCYDQIRISIAYPKLNVKIVGSHAGLTAGPDGPTHQAIDDIALMRALPNMMVLEPADKKEMKIVLNESIKHNGPVYIRINRGSSPEVCNIDDICYKKINILKKGNDVGILASGFMVDKALKAAKILETEYINALVADIHCIKPIDVDTLLDIARKVRFILTIENHSIIGGMGSAVSEILAELYPLPIIKMGVKDTFAESADTMQLFEKYGLTEANIIDIIKRHLKSNF